MTRNPDGGHASDAELLALVHGESVEGAAWSHLADCDACRARRRDLAREDAAIGALLAELDLPHPAGDLPDIELPVRRGMRRGLVATAATLLLGAAALAALPASPFRQWIAGRSGSEAASPEPFAAGTAPTGGVAVPVEGPMEIRLLHDPEGGTLQLRRVAGAELALRTEGGRPAFSIGDGVVTIDNTTPASAYLVDWPRTAVALRIKAGSRVLLRWPADSARLAGAIDADGVLHLDLADHGAPR